ncbi:hypothetical protein CF394_06845 [Tetzosporium hominis]|uniref:DUF805 domain-containing protein n=1 Tax=Tetzosporium hominis TaxID=2020506 RepID=A0A264W4D9_9BACL|nr:DUF805 domain-containing protein [Tetzosporium hominis]OZS78468.1 hypothetical protein CF394_06845 [Tetzosporium hominis]
MSWFIHVMKNTFNFNGRARRKEYWMFALMTFVISFVLTMIDIFAGLEFAPEVGILSTIFGLIILIPSLAVTVRRLHDTGRSGAWILIGLIPLIGWIVMLVFMVLDSQPETNRFGPNPKAASTQYNYSV